MTSLSRTPTAWAMPSKPCSASSSMISSKAVGRVWWVIVIGLPWVGWHLPGEPAVTCRFKPSPRRGGRGIYRNQDARSTVVRTPESGGVGIDFKHACNPTLFYGSLEEDHLRMATYREFQQTAPVLSRDNSPVPGLAG